MADEEEIEENLENDDEKNHPVIRPDARSNDRAN